MKTLVAFDNIVIYVFHFNLTAIVCISNLNVTFIKLLLTYLFKIQTYANVVFAITCFIIQINSIDSITST